MLVFDEEGWFWKRVLLCVCDKKVLWVFVGICIVGFVLIFSSFLWGDKIVDLGVGGFGFWNG